ncbi:MAG: hypothetical protein MJZ11_08170 [Lachnospiraceae bacterium]|nr:hypothetical protein [Lachnospiraceae bacterium]
MISITEKTADKMCKEFRELIVAADHTLEEEAENFQEVTEAFNKLNKEGPLFSMAQTMYDGATKRHLEARQKIENDKQMYLGFIEALMVGETA